MLVTLETCTAPLSIMTCGPIWRNGMFYLIFSPSRVMAKNFPCYQKICNDNSQDKLKDLKIKALNQINLQLHCLI